MMEQKHGNYKRSDVKKIIKIFEREMMNKLCMRISERRMNTDVIEQIFVNENIVRHIMHNRIDWSCREKNDCTQTAKERRNQKTSWTIKKPMARRNRERFPTDGWYTDHRDESGEESFWKLS